VLETLFIKNRVKIIRMAVKFFYFPEKEAPKQIKTAQVQKALGKKTT
jgi:hypothetical protein